MNIRQRAASLAACGYLLAGIIAFGHSAAESNGCTSKNGFAADPEYTVISAAGAAIFWPLYLSWVAFDARGSQ